MMVRALYALACTLVVAGITHIAVILLIPRYTTEDAFAILAERTPELAFQTLSVAGPQSPLSDVDPYFQYGVCRFSLDSEGVALSGPAVDSFWSATIIDRSGTVHYSLNSRTAIGGQFNLLILDPVQILRLREVQPPEIETAIVVEADLDEGFVLLRVLSPDPSWETRAKAFLNSLTCERYVPGVSEQEEGAETAPQS